MNHEVTKTTKRSPASSGARFVNFATQSVGKPAGCRSIRIYEKVVGHDGTPPTGVDQMSLRDVVTTGADHPAVRVGGSL